MNASALRLALVVMAATFAGAASLVACGQAASGVGAANEAGSDAEARETSGVDGGLGAGVDACAGGVYQDAACGNGGIYASAPGPTQQVCACASGAECVGVDPTAVGGTFTAAICLPMPFCAGFGTAYDPSKGVECGDGGVYAGTTGYSGSYTPLGSFDSTPTDEAVWSPGQEVCACPPGSACGNDPPVTNQATTISCLTPLGVQTCAYRSYDSPFACGAGGLYFNGALTCACPTNTQCAAVGSNMVSCQ